MKFIVITAVALVVFLFGGCSMQSDHMFCADNLDSPYETLYETYDSDFYPGSEKYGEYQVNPFIATIEDNLSTFAIDVDNGSYTLGRKKINEGQLPPESSIRVEEYINYFQQDYHCPENGPFSVNVDGAKSPFRDSLYILRIGLMGKKPTEERKSWNITFLVDVSGSMESRLPLVKQSLYELIDNMSSMDKISICTYAGCVKTILTPVAINELGKGTIKSKISDLNSNGGTAMASGIKNAYRTNMQGFIPKGVNRVVVCSDGDANIGQTSHKDILKMIKSYVDEGITLSTIGFGQGNYNDLMMEQLSNKGNGNYYYIDSPKEAKRLFTQELTSIMEVIAKNVKIQVEFNKDAVKRYRLLGYENRNIKDTDFDKDTTDAGELGAGHRVTALYEIELDDKNTVKLGTVHLRYQLPDGTSDIQLTTQIEKSSVTQDFEKSSKRFRFTAAVCEYAEILRNSPYTTTAITSLKPMISSSYNIADERDVEFLTLYRKVVGLKK